MEEFSLKLSDLRACILLTKLSSLPAQIFFLIILTSRLKFFLIFIYLFIFYLWLCWVFVSVRGLSLVVASGDHSSSWCAGLSLQWPLLLRSTGSRRAGSVVVAHGPSCSAACGIFPDQGSKPCPPALAGGFLTTAPPGKSLPLLLPVSFCPRDILPYWC